MGKCASKTSRADENDKLGRETQHARAWLASELQSSEESPKWMVDVTNDSELHIIDAENDGNGEFLDGAQGKGLTAALSAVDDTPSVPEVRTFADGSPTVQREAPTPSQQSTLAQNNGGIRSQQDAIVQESRGNGSQQNKFKKAVNAVMTTNMLMHAASDVQAKRKDDERIVLEGLMGNKVTPSDSLVLSDTSIRKARPLSAVSLCSNQSTLTLESDASCGMRLDEWDRSIDRNLCHVYRLCEEYQQLGYGQIRPDRNCRGVDFLISKTHRRANLEEIPDGQHAAWSGDDNQVARIKEVLRKCEFWNTLGSTMPGFFGKLASKAAFANEAKGQIVFRQGDTAGDVYLLVRGEITVHRLPDEDLEKVNSPRVRDCKNITTLSEALGLGAPVNSRKSIKRRRSSTGSQSPGFPGSPLPGSLSPNLKTNPNQRYLTTEGFSTFCENSKIGDQIARRSSYLAIGEKLSLAKGVKRPATIKCASPCEFLVIAGAAYKEILRSVATRVAFFDGFVPGSKENSGNGFHPSHIFMEARYQQGHTFLTEGIASPPIIFVVLSGTIEMQRCEDPEEDPGHQFHRTASRFAKEWVKDRHATQKYDVLTKGDIFSSLSCFPIQAYEPFSAEVTSPEAIVYHIEGTYLEKLPPKMLQALRQDLMKGLIERLLRVREKIPEAFIPAVRGGLSPSEKSMTTMENNLFASTRRQRRSPPARSVSPSTSGNPVWDVPGVVSSS